MDSYDGADAIERAWRDGLKPDPLLTVSEWADRDQTLRCRRHLERVDDQSGNGALQRCGRQAPSAAVRLPALSHEPPRDIIELALATPHRMGWCQALPSFVGELADQRRMGSRGSLGLHPARVGL
jgi:hypothetical protein